jgi:hypothetical protein
LINETTENNTADKGDHCTLNVEKYSEPHTTSTIGSPQNAHLPIPVLQKELTEKILSLQIKNNSISN